MTLCMLWQAHAGDGWQPDRNAVYTLTLQPSNTVYKLTYSDLEWQKALKNRLHIEDWIKIRGHTIMTFVLTNHRCVLNETDALPVYVDMDDPDTLLVINLNAVGFKGHGFVIQLKDKSVGDSGYKYMHPSKNFITFFNDGGKRLIAMPVGDWVKDASSDKWISTEPIFNNNQIIWW